MAQGALAAAGVTRVGYGLEVGRSVRTAGGAAWQGHIVSPRAQLVLIFTSPDPLGERKRYGVSRLRSLYMRMCMNIC